MEGARARSRGADEGEAGRGVKAGGGDATLRPATSEDAGDVARVILESRKAFLPYAPLAHADDDVARWVRDVLVPAGGVTVAAHGSQIVGVLATASKGGVSWITQLYVLPDHVGQGVGSRLLGLAMRQLARPVRLYTFQANDGARGFYERHGFAPIGFGDGSGNEEQCADVLYEFVGRCAYQPIGIRGNELSDARAHGVVSQSAIGSRNGGSKEACPSIAVGSLEQVQCAQFQLPEVWSSRSALTPALHRNLRCGVLPADVLDAHRASRGKCDDRHDART